MQIAEATMERFKFLPKVAWVVLVLPHNNADLERLFSIAKKNKTDARLSLKLDGTYSSTLSVVPCYKLQLDSAMIR